MILSIVWDWLKDRDLHKLAMKYSAVGVTYLASHIVALTTTPAYANWWGRFYLTAPQITNIPAFEKKLTALLLIAWITVEHYFWGIPEQQGEQPK